MGLVRGSAVALAVLSSAYILGTWFMASPHLAVTHFLVTWAGMEGPQQAQGSAAAGSAWSHSVQLNQSHFLPLLDRVGRNPIVFIPPLGGVQLEVTAHDKPSVPHAWCRRNFGWQRGWVNIRMLLPWAFDCFVDNFRVHCEKGKRCRSPQGVKVRPKPGFDSAMTVLPGGGPPFSVFARLASVLEVLGWQREVDMLAHIYDWRLSPQEYMAAGGSFEQLQRLIEDATRQAGRPAIAISLSMGSPYFALFLRGQTQAWKDWYVAGHIALSGVWGGSPIAPLALVSGLTDNGWDAAANRKAVRDLARGLPSVSWLAPSTTISPEHQILVTNDATGKEYTAEAVGELLMDAGATQAAFIWGANKPTADDQSNPGVPLYCLYGTGLDTISSATYATADFSDVRARVSFTEGDGTAPLASLQVCDSWRQQRQRDDLVHVRRYPGVRHADLLRNQEAFADVLGFVIDLTVGPGDWE